MQIHTTHVVDTHVTIVAVSGERTITPIQSDMLILPILNGEYGTIISSDRNNQLGNKL